MLHNLKTLRGEHASKLTGLLLKMCPRLLELASETRMVTHATYDPSLRPIVLIFTNLTSNLPFFLAFQVKIPLCQVDLAQTINEWKDVQSCKEDDEYLGDICFSLRSG